MGGSLAQRHAATPSTAASRYSSVSSSELMPDGSAPIEAPDRIWRMKVNPEQALRLAREALAIEADAVRALQQRLGDGFVQALQLMLDVRGRVVVMGIGKSGHVGRKIAATLASTGTPAMFVHPAEASHGDLGMIKPVDVVLAISNSGESEELNVVVPLVRRLGAPLMAMTGHTDSTLAHHADGVLDSGVEKEACPLNLAPN